MQNVHNISHIGNSTNYVTPVEIDSWHYSAITIINSSMVTIKNFMITGNYYLVDFSLKILSCYYVQLHNVTMNRALLGYNMMWESVLSNITSDELHIIYNDDISVESVNIHKLICNYITTREGYVKMEQNFCNVSIIITNSIFSESITVLINSSCTTQYEKTVVIDKTHIRMSFIYHYCVFIHFSVYNHHCSNKSINKHDKVIIKNCFFLDINLANEIIYIKWLDRISETIQI